MEISDYEIKKIAFAFDRLTYDFDPYAYADAVQNPAENIEKIFENLKSGNVKDYVSWLCDVSSEEWDAIGLGYREKADDLYLQIVDFMDLYPSGRYPQSLLREAFDRIALSY